MSIAWVAAAGVESSWDGLTILEPVTAADYIDVA
jgi:hypothetical protein